VEDLQEIGDLGEDVAGVCGNTIPKDSKATEVKGFGVRDEGSDKMTLVFNRRCSGLRNQDAKYADPSPRATE
jgi:hypothetical protein